MAETKRKGDLGVIMVMADALKRGYKVAMPVGDDWDCDLIVFRNGKLERVQCKYVESNGEYLQAKCRSTSGVKIVKKYTKRTIEWLAVYDKTSNKCYYIPANFLGEGKCNLNLRLTKAKNNQKKKIHLAKDFLDW